MNEEELEQLALQEILLEAKRGKARAEAYGPSGWEKPKLPATNKRFLRTTLFSTLSDRTREAKNKARRLKQKEILNNDRTFHRGDSKEARKDYMQKKRRHSNKPESRRISKGKNDSCREDEIDEKIESRSKAKDHHYESDYDRKGQDRSSECLRHLDTERTERGHSSDQKTKRNLKHDVSSREDCHRKKHRSHKKHKRSRSSSSSSTSSSNTHRKHKKRHSRKLEHDKK
ncbi:uncharacterized protein LOC144439502 [Glandiceps talaboti]